jgi:hypothetical protein
VGGDLSPDHQCVDGGLGAKPRPPGPLAGGDDRQSIKRYDDFVAEAKVLLTTARFDQHGRVKDDVTRWALGDLMVEMWPRRDGTKEEATQIQKELHQFATEIGVNHGMLKDWYYVAEQWPTEDRVAEKSFAQHSKLRGRADRGWALLGIAQGDQEDLEPLKNLNQTQIRKVEKVLQAIEQLDGASSAVLDAVVTRLKPIQRGKARTIIAALRQREKQARKEAAEARNRKSPIAIVFTYQADLLAAAARAQALVELVEGLRTQPERDYVRTVIEGAVYVNQRALEDALDALDQPAPADSDVIDADSKDAKGHSALPTAS